MTAPRGGVKETWKTVNSYISPRPATNAQGEKMRKSQENNPLSTDYQHPDRPQMAGADNYVDAVCIIIYVAVIFYALILS